MAHRRVLLTWLAMVAAMIVLYTCVPPVFFNDGTGRIAGMPEMLFWFTLMPFVAPALIGAVYLYDGRLLRRLAAARTAVARTAVARTAVTRTAVTRTAVTRTAVTRTAEAAETDRDGRAS